MKSDIQIAQEAKMEHIHKIAAQVGLEPEDLELYGDYKAKVKLEVLEKYKDTPDAKLVLVTAITPTPAGEGKSTTSVGLGQALNQMGHKTAIALREPSLGPCFGIKGGAAGGGYAQVVPMEDINLHFTGDIHAMSTAHNLLAAALDNHIKQGNELGIDPTRITYKRAMDMNERALRQIIVGLGGTANGLPREDGFMITVASEIMAILCLSTDLKDLKERLGRIVIGHTFDRKPVTARDLKVHGAMAALLKDAIKPNLVQTLENNPAFVHGGPFANIAHGCNSIMATRMAMKLSDIAITEAGFGADLGAEKFLDIKCRFGGLKPNAVVLVATARALKMHGGLGVKELKEENVEALEKGLENLEKHIENMQSYGLPLVVALNRFPHDTDAELQAIHDRCKKLGVEVAHSNVWAEGGKGGIELGEAVLRAMEQENNFKFLYDVEEPIKDKLEKIATRIYGADGVDYLRGVDRKIKNLEEQGYGNMPICVAKTQASLSDDPKLVGRPRNFRVSVRDITVSAGAGFLVALAGDIMTMPGLPKRPAAEGIDIDEKGKITGLF